MSEIKGTIQTKGLESLSFSLCRLWLVGSGLRVGVLLISRESVHSISHACLGQAVRVVLCLLSIAISWPLPPTEIICVENPILGILKK